MMKDATKVEMLYHSDKRLIKNILALSLPSALITRSVFDVMLAEEETLLMHDTFTLLCRSQTRVTLKIISSLSSWWDTILYGTLYFLVIIDF